MTTLNFIIFALLCPASALLAQSGCPRIVTLVLDSGTTNSEQRIESYESVRVVSATFGGCSTLRILKGSNEFSVLDSDINGERTYYYHIPPKQVVCAGPAIVRFRASYCGITTPIYVTLEITPQSFPPDRTVIVPPGTNQVAVALECSTNLVQWLPATNGIYGSPTEAKFFRIKADKVN